LDQSIGNDEINTSQLKFVS